MTSVAEKLRRHRVRQRLGAGRPRKQGERYPSGDIQRGETEKEALSVGLEARKRVHLIDGADGKSTLAGYTLGRMFLDGNIKEMELQAGDWYTEQMARYYKLTGRQFPHPRAQDLFGAKGSSGDVTESLEKRARIASNQFMAMEAALLRCESGSQVKTTVFNVCIMDMENLRMMPPHQIGLLKRGLQALIFQKGIAG